MIILLGVLSALQRIKLGGVQIEDVPLLFLLAFCSAKALCSGGSIHLSRTVSEIFRSYCLLLLAIVVLSILAFRLPFYPLSDLPVYKQPLLLSLSRILQFAAILCGFFWFTNALLRNRDLLVQALSAYYWTGIASSIYAILSQIATVIFHLEPGAFSPLGVSYIGEDLRARGLFNEGGPFGIYLLSVLVVGLLRRRLTGKRLGIANIAVIMIAFLLSASKAGFLAGCLLCFYSIVSAASFRKKVAYFFLFAVLLSGAAAWLDIWTQLLGYKDSYDTLEQTVAAPGIDPDLSTGRVGALYITPRMIAAHPITGIGFGNYPAIRNDPHYLGSLPPVDVEDLPALGIIGLAAEIGVPMTLWLLILLFTPYWIMRKRGSLIALALLFQPVAHIFAVQVTFFYPWFVSGCAIAAASSATGSPSK